MVCGGRLVLGLRSIGETFGRLTWWWHCISRCFRAIFAVEEYLTSAAVMRGILKVMIKSSGLYGIKQRRVRSHVWTRLPWLHV